MRSRLYSVWLILLIAAFVHADLHFGRPAHMHWSFGARSHSLLAVQVFARAAVGVARRGPDRLAAASLVNVVGGLFVGQIVEPAIEPLVYHFPFFHAWQPPRWSLFFEFALVGLLVYAVTLALVARRARSLA